MSADPQPAAPEAPAAAEPALQPLLVDARTAARLLSLSPRSLWGLTRDGEIPVLKIGRSVRYDPADLVDWVRRRKAIAQANGSG